MTRALVGALVRASLWWVHRAGHAGPVLTVTPRPAAHSPLKSGLPGLKTKGGVLVWRCVHTRGGGTTFPPNYHIYSFGITRGFSRNTPKWCILRILS